jgi:hypothetical protein
VAHLGSKVESQITAAGKGILDQQGDFVGEAQLHSLGETCSLAEVGEVLQGKGQSYGFGELDVNVRIRLLHISFWSQSDGSVADISSTREFDTLLGGFDGDCTRGRVRCS